jgi:invasion protein IalB
MAEWIARARGARLALAGAGMVAGLGLVALAVSSPAAYAQQKKAAAKQAAAPQASQSAWVKLCETAKYQKMGADGKPQFDKDKKPVLEDKKLCLTHHEQMTAAGVTLVSAAIQQLEGVEKLGMMVMVPSAVGLTIPTGMKVIVYDKAQWEKAQKKEKIDETKLVAQNLVFTMCHQNGCTAENEATPQLVDAMKKGAVMVALAIHVSGRPVSFQVPLNGFATTIDGKPVDNALYKEQREKLWAHIRGNQLEQIKKYQEQLQKQGGAGAAGGPAPAKK